MPYEQNITPLSHRWSKTSRNNTASGKEREVCCREGPRGVVAAGTSKKEGFFVNGEGKNSTIVWGNT